MGPTHAEWLTMIPEAELKAVCDIDEHRAKEIAAEYHVDWYTDYHDILERKDIEAVTIVTPNYLHAPMAIEAAKAGKHVAVEKPLCINLKEADEMIKAVKKAGVLDLYCENLCFAPSYSMAKDIIDEGGLGDVYMVRCREAGGVGVSPELKEYLASQKEPVTWYADYKKAGGGMLLSTGIHCITYIRHILNRETATKVYAELKTIMFPDERIEDVALVTVRYKGGQLGWIDTAISALGTYDDRAEIYGTQGTIFLDMYRRNPILVYSQPGYGPIGGSMFEPVLGADKNWSYPIPDEKRSLGYWHEERHFMKCILAGNRPKVNFDDGRASVEVVMAAYKSHATGNAVSLPLQE